MSREFKEQGADEPIKMTARRFCSLREEQKKTERERKKTVTRVMFL